MQGHDFLKPLILLVTQSPAVVWHDAFQSGLLWAWGSNARHPATEMVVTQNRGQQGDFVPLDP